MRGFIPLVAALTLALPAQAAIKTTNGSGAMVRTLDRITGQTTDYEMPSGSSIEQGYLRVTLRECRYPRRGLNRDAYAQFLIEDKRQSSPAFQGWMVASSPALSALEHPRYDVWVLKCLAPK